MKKLQYKKGDKIGELTFIKEIPKTFNNRRAQWKCFCGNIFDADISNVKGTTNSCGCTRHIKFNNMIKKHGEHGSYVYNLWRNVKARCLNSKYRDYHYYGGRGITMYAEWQFDYVKFRDWINENLGKRPPTYSLDRKDNEGNYEPGNLRWASKKEQANNRRL